MYDSPFARPLNASNPGHAVWVGCGSDAGQNAVLEAFSRVTVSPTRILKAFGDKPPEVSFTVYELGLYAADAVGVGETATDGVGLEDCSATSSPDESPLK